jgi:hypothetical protein
VEAAAYDHRQRILREEARLREARQESAAQAGFQPGSGHTQACRPASFLAAGLVIPRLHIASQAPILGNTRRCLNVRPWQLSWMTRSARGCAVLRVCCSVRCCQRLAHNPMLGSAAVHPRTHRPTANPCRSCHAAPKLAKQRLSVLQQMHLQCSRLRWPRLVYRCVASARAAGTNPHMKQALQCRGHTQPLA